jgi:autotransporter-associated beta strand protein
MNDLSCTSPSRARVLATVTMLLLLAVLWTPTSAAAATFMWNKDANGDWNQAGNWACADIDCGAGFPNRPGDTAVLGSAFTEVVTITLPDAPVTVGTIRFVQNTPFGIAAGGGGSRMILDSGGAGPAQVVSEQARQQEFDVPITLQSSLSIVGPALRACFFTRAIDGPGGITISNSDDDKSSFAVVEFDLIVGESSTYAGQTVVETGALLALGRDAAALGANAVSGTNSVPGPLVIGSGTQGITVGGVVVVSQPDQIADTARVTLRSDGEIFFAAADQVGEVTNGGTIIADQAVVSMADVRLIDGTMRAQHGGGLRLLGDLSATGHSVVSGDDGTEIFELQSANRQITIPAPSDGLVVIDIRLISAGEGKGLRKSGPGVLTFGGLGTNAYTGLTDVQQGTLRSTRTTVAIPGALTIRGGAGVDLDGANTIAATATATLASQARLSTTTDQTIQQMAISGTGTLNVSAGVVSTSRLFLTGGHVSVGSGTLRLTRELDAVSSADTAALIDVSHPEGHIAIASADDLLVSVGGVAGAIALRIDAPIVGPAGKGLVKQGVGSMRLTGANTYTGTTRIEAGTVLVNGAQPASAVSVVGGVLGGIGMTANVSATDGSTIAPGNGIGRLTTGALALATGVILAIEMNGGAPGATYDQLDVRGTVALNDATLVLAPSFTPPINAQFTLINNDGIDPVDGTFAGLAEGATITAGGSKFVISYRGGDGNDVVVTRAGQATDVAPTYYLSEGATGGFFDEDVLIANPNDTAAPVTLTFSKEDGTQVVATRTVPAQARLTVHVDQIPGLESTAVSAQVTSDAKVPLVVERSMFWDSSYYAGHTGTAVDQPAPDWFFAEGSQGFFNTFVLVINPNTTPTDVTFTFFRESEPTVIKTVTVGATTRLTLFAGDVPDLVNRSFGIAVHATQAIMAERSMYFGTRPDGQLSGGSESAGVTAPSTHWFMAEGATGGFFDTFILLSNPQDTAAHVQLQYLLDTGETITVPKTIAAHARLTTNIEAEDDVRLKNAAVSTVVTSDVAIIAERSMYWPGVVLPWGEGHNSFGVVDAGTAWGLGEGRIGGPHNFHTYILLANPQTTSAEVTVSYLRESGVPVTKTYTVAPTSRFNIDTSSVTDLHDESFGAVIRVTNGVPIIVERSMYWDANGIAFSGGTNATGIPLPVSTTGAGQ